MTTNNMVEPGCSVIRALLVIFDEKLYQKLLQSPNKYNQMEFPFHKSLCNLPSTLVAVLCKNDLS